MPFCSQAYNNARSSRKGVTLHSVALSAVTFLSVIMLLNGCTSQPAMSTVSTVTAPLHVPATSVSPASNSLKHKVAIAQFGFSDDDDAPSDAMAQASRQTKQFLDNGLKQTQHFMLLTHERLQIPLQPSDLLVVNDDMLGADYLVAGEIQRHDVTLPGMFDGWRSPKTARARSIVLLRVIDAHSGQEVLAHTSQGEITREIHDKTPLDNAGMHAMQDAALSMALNNALPALTQHLLQRRWRGQILSTQQGFVLVNSGAGQGIQIGDEFYVVASEHALTVNALAAPATGSPFLATLRVVAHAGENEQELSVCELVEGSLPVDDVGKLSVLSARHGH